MMTDPLTAQAERRDVITKWGHDLVGIKRNEKVAVFKKVKG